VLLDNLEAVLISLGRPVFVDDLLLSLGRRYERKTIQVALGILISEGRVRRVPNLGDMNRVLYVRRPTREG